MTRRPESPVICHVVYARYPADPRVRREAEALSRNGFDVDLICLRGPGEKAHETVGGVHVTRLPLRAIRGSRMRYIYQYSLFFLLAATCLVTKQIRRWYDAVHIHSMPDFLIFAALPSRLLGCQLVLDLHESMPELYLARFVDRERSVLHRLTLIAQRASCLLATRVVSVNDQIAALLERRGIAPWRVCVIENAPDWSLVDFQPPAAASGTPFTIVVVGGLNEERDVGLVIEAASEVARLARTRWRLIGDGNSSYLDALRSKVGELGLSETITIEPEVPSSAVPALIHGSAIGIVSYVKNPITEIATPNKAYEYATAGKAMVVADLPALKTLLGDTATYYEPGNAMDLARGVSTLLYDDELRLRLGREARARISTHAWPIMEMRLIRMYENMNRRNAVTSAHDGTDDRSPGIREA